jgi:hypothetical protein
MMAWVRTATSMISFGFTIHKFFQFREQGGAAPLARLLGPGEFGGVLVASRTRRAGVRTLMPLALSGGRA